MTEDKLPGHSATKYVPQTAAEWQRIASDNPQPHLHALHEAMKQKLNDYVWRVDVAVHDLSAASNEQLIRHGVLVQLSSSPVALPLGKLELVEATIKAVMGLMTGLKGPSSVRLQEDASGRVTAEIFHPVGADGELKNGVAVVYEPPNVALARLSPSDVEPASHVIEGEFIDDESLPAGTPVKGNLGA